MEEILDELGLLEVTKKQGSDYIIELNDSNEYQNLFDYLNSLDELTLDEDSVEFNEDINEVTFNGDKIKLKLIADFKNNKYVCVPKIV